MPASQCPAIPGPGIPASVARRPRAPLSTCPRYHPRHTHRKTLKTRKSKSPRQGGPGVGDGRGKRAREARPRASIRDVLPLLTEAPKVSTPGKGGDRKSKARTGAGLYGVRVCPA